MAYDKIWVTGAGVQGFDQFTGKLSNRLYEIDLSDGTTQPLASSGQVTWLEAAFGSVYVAGERDSSGYHPVRKL